MDTDTAITLGTDLMRQHGFGHIPFKVSRQKRALASFMWWRPNKDTLYMPHEIRFSKYYIEQLDREAFVEVMMHEIAHGKAGPNEGHGRKWQRIAISLGAKPEACHSDPNIEQPAHTVEGICPNGHSVKYYRLPLRVKSCSRCRPGKHDMRFTFAWYKHGKRVPESAMPLKYRQEMSRLNNRIKYGTYS